MAEDFATKGKFRYMYLLRSSPLLDMGFHRAPVTFAWRQAHRQCGATLPMQAMVEVVMNPVRSLSSVAGVILHDAASTRVCLVSIHRSQEGHCLKLGNTGAAAAYDCAAKPE